MGPDSGRLSAVVASADGDSGPVGEVGSETLGLYVPAGGPRRLVVVLHGAGGRPADALGLLRPVADAAGLLLLAPASTGRTWDVILGGYGPDVARLDAAVAMVGRRWQVRPGPWTIAGFSDGASYALSLGLANGDLVERIVAFSPGVAAPAARVGRPPVFVSHGTADRVLPIDRCGRRIVRDLRAGGYAVTYEEFAGGHAVPDGIRDRAVAWL
jgi:phospholipase/carboxylesterase